MKQDNIIKVKTKNFALRIIKLSKYLKPSMDFYSMLDQLFRSGTGIGALVREAEYAQSKKDFINKSYIALKEANETLYWLELMHESDYITQEEFDSIAPDCIEIIKILTAIINTTKENINMK